MQSQRWLVGLSIGLTLSMGAESVWPATALDVVDLAARLTAIGPRVSGTPEQELAAAELNTAISEIGLEPLGRLGVAAGDSWHSLGGLLPGGSLPEVVLSAHYDTVAHSPGALDNASGTAVALAAAVELSRTPRSRSVRILLFDGEEALAAGSRSWLAAAPDEISRRTLANLDLDMVGARGARQGVIHILGSQEAGGLEITPAWLVHAVLQGAAAVEFPVVVMDPNWSWLAQLSARCTRARRISDGDRFLERGIPALRLSDLPLTGRGIGYHSVDDRWERLDGERLRSWTLTVASTARRLDRLTGRPVAESEYLVFGKRVVIRRQLIWVGFALWVALVFSGLPGRWRGAAAGERRRAGRAYLPGFAFRMLFLIALFTIPTFATLLLYPVALLALWGPRGGARVRRVLCWLGASPTLGFCLWLAAGQFAGWFTLTSAAFVPALLVALVLITFCAWMADWSAAVLSPSSAGAKASSASV